MTAKANQPSATPDCAHCAPGDSERAELLNPAGWYDALERFARSTGLAVVLTDVAGMRLGPIHNPSPIWSAARTVAPAGEGKCPFCLGPPTPCTAAVDAWHSGQPAFAVDGLGLAHVAVPLRLDETDIGVLLAGQVFNRFPEQLQVERIARWSGASPQTLWHLARRQQPFGGDRLRLCGDLLATLGQSIINARHGAIVERLRIEEKRAEEALQEADRRKSEFLAMLGHELRNPLAPIQTAIETLRRTAPINDACGPTLDMMSRQVRHMVRLVDDLLDVSRISRGRIELKRAPVELSAVVEQALESTRPLADATGHAFRVSLPAERLWLFADSARLVQVIGNLLGNACKYSEGGTEIHLHVDKQNDQVAIRVRDSGIGLASEELDRVFEMFTQLDTSLERSKGGMGIGLGLVKRLVELHGGTVEARSEGPGRGAEFIVRLPLATAPVTDHAKHSPARPVLASGLRILVVDDNRDAADSLATLLQMSSHHVRAVHDGLDAVVATEDFLPQVVLLDLGLPTIDGYETARRIRQQRNGRDLLLVALSGWGQAEDLRRSRDAGFDAHLVKPVRFTKLMELLAEKMAEKSAASSASSMLSATREP